jgi:hypothetical protein
VRLLVIEDYSPLREALARGLREAGGLTQIASVPTKEGARNGVVSRDGHVYLGNSKDSELVVVGPWCRGSASGSSVITSCPGYRGRAALRR